MSMIFSVYIKGCSFGITSKGLSQKTISEFTCCNTRSHDFSHGVLLSKRCKRRRTLGKVRTKSLNAMDGIRRGIKSKIKRSGTDWRF